MSSHLVMPKVPKVVACNDSWGSEEPKIIPREQNWDDGVEPESHVSVLQKIVMPEIPFVACDESWNLDPWTATYDPKKDIEKRNVIRGPLIGKSKTEKRRYRQMERLRHDGFAC